MVAQVLLVNGKGVALIDDDDWSLVSAFSWSLSQSGARDRRYARTKRNGEAIYLHRLVMGAVRGDGREVDHKDGDGLNCQKENLRFVTHAANMANRRGANHNSTTGIRGVYLRPKNGKYYVNCEIGGRKVSRGLFSSIEAARSTAAALIEQMTKALDAGPEYERQYAPMIRPSDRLPERRGD